MSNPSQTSRTNPPTDLPGQEDKEAAGLLMLFSTQSHRLNPSAGQQDTEKNISPPLPASKLQPSVLVPAPATAPVPPALASVPEATAADPTQSPDNNVPNPSISSFQMHRRTTSMSKDTHSTSSKSMRMDQMARSPGPAAAALASGNGSNKAIVAAAALAAAAATPLPVFRKTEQNNTADFRLHEPIAFPQDNNKVDEYSSVRKKEKFKSARGESRQHNAKDAKQDNKANDDIVHTETKKEEDIVSGNALPSYAVGPDAGIISCICGYDHDDGLTIQCDKCFRWQHLVCMGFESINDTPDDFQCNLCNKNLHVDAARAKKLQENYLKEEKSKKKRSPYAVESSKANTKNIGAAQFKKRKVDDNSAEAVGVNKYKTLYFPIDYFVFRSSSIKSLYDQLPELLKKNKQIVRVDKPNLNKMVLNSATVNIKSTPENSKMKFTGISKLGLYSTKTVKDSGFISLFSGEIDTKQNYISEKINKYWLLGCPKPGVFFHPSLPIVIDERGLGNHTRFIRKSCKPNCEIRTIVVNRQETALGLFATKEIKADHELTLPWEWEVDHPILKIINNTETFESMNTEMKMVLINSIQCILDLTDCGCYTSSSDCVISKVKKMSAYLQRSTRKSNMTHLSPTPHQKYIPIDARYRARDEYILDNIASESVPDDELMVNQGIENAVTGDAQDGKDVNVEVLKDGSLTNSEGMVTSFSFKSKPKSTVYNLHILPKQFELLRKYLRNGDVKDNAEVKPGDEVTKSGKIDNEQESNMPIPVEVHARVLQRLNNVSGEHTFEGAKEHVSVVGADVEERPKVVKKFSLADYKKKKIG
ncbi:hypothetical protein PMKS-000946 [Pichia membranifaciens]|uniref:SET domain-containing protein n=1 Tax=Pichia membranifaciens TaxID=4926 RepID=A0A1Q2YD99_9ASCO|nr:hypothetical protein PMKS-000946 [Pichia membranifaciens]